MRAYLNEISSEHNYTSRIYSRIKHVRKKYEKFPSSSYFCPILTILYDCHKSINKTEARLDSISHALTKSQTREA